MNNDKYIPWWNPSNEPPMMEQYVRYFSPKRNYKILEWSKETYYSMTHSEALSMEDDIWKLPSFVDFFELSRENYETFEKGYFWGKEVHPTDNVLGFGYNITHNYSLMIYIPEKTAMVRLIRKQILNV